MMFFWFFFVLAIPLFLFWMMRSQGGGGVGMGCCGSHAGHGSTAQSGQSDAVVIARERFAKGEISADEYETIRKALS